MDWTALGDFAAREKCAEEREWERLNGILISELEQDGRVLSGSLQGELFSGRNTENAVRLREDDRVMLLPLLGNGTLGQAIRQAGDYVVTADIEAVLANNKFDLQPRGRLQPGPCVMSPAGPLEEGYENLFNVLEACNNGTAPELDAFLSAALDRKPPLFCTHEALRKTLNSEVNPGKSEFHLIQGPPGTGKTHLIGQLVAEWANKGYSVLVTAFTNRAVDEILRKIVTANTPNNVPPLIRVGRDRIRKELNIQCSNNIAPRPGSVLGTTLYKCAQRAAKGLGSAFDVVIIDEGSQVTLPSFCATSLLGRAIILVGDHRQLAPVVVQQPSNEPGEDLYRMSAFEYLVNRHPFYCLNETRRLNRHVCTFISAKYYDGTLTPHTSSADQVWPSDLSEPVWMNGSPGVCHIVATPEQYPQQCSPHEADIVAQIIEQIEKIKGTWLSSRDHLNSSTPPTLVAPYERRYVISCLFREQVALVRKALNNKSIKGHLWQVDTVERNQGQTGSIAILCVGASDETQGRDRAWTLDPRRWNVALSRGRFAAYVVASSPFCDFIQNNAKGLVSTVRI